MLKINGFRFIGYNKMLMKSDLTVIYDIINHITYILHLYLKWKIIKQTHNIQSLRTT